MHDYNNFQFDWRELVPEMAVAVLRVVFTGILFFHSWIGCLALSPLALWHLSVGKNKKREKRRSELRLDFRDTVLSIASSLHAGYTIEQSVSIALEDLKRLYPGERRAMETELLWMLRKLELNVPIEQLFEDLANRSGLEEIENYATILATVKSQGGNLVRISRETAEHISQKIQMQTEIEQMIAGRKLEKDIMIRMPYFILIYLQLANREYMAVLFHNLPGVLCMAFCLAAIHGADWWSGRITEIGI